MDDGVHACFDPQMQAAAFRRVLGRFATGVTLITTTSEEGPVGIVANSFASVSLDPPLVLWSPARDSRRFKYFAHAPRFAIHVLSSDQRDVCAAFAASRTAFEHCEWETSPWGIPLIKGALATFECDLQATHDAGDHVIVVGEVKRYDTCAGKPLVFLGGKYGEFAET